MVAVPIEGLLDLSLRLSLDHRVSVYDALYLALALERDVRLVTEDAKLFRAFAGGPLSQCFVSMASLVSELEQR